MTQSAEPSYASLLNALQQSTPSTHAAKAPAKKRRRSTSATSVQPPQSFYDTHFNSNAWEGDPPAVQRSFPNATPDGTALLAKGNLDALPDMDATDLQAYSIPQRLQARWTDATGRSDLAPPIQSTAFALLNRYLDVCMTTTQHSAQITDALLLHIVTHCAQAADLIKKNNDAPEPRPRDQGFARTKALLLLPMRNVAANVVLRLAALAQRETRADSIQHKQRFVDEYAANDDARGQ